MFDHRIKMNYFFDELFIYFLVQEEGPAALVIDRIILVDGQ